MMSQTKPTQRVGFTEREIAALIDAVNERIEVVFPGPNGNSEVFNTDKQEAWEQIAVIVNAVEGKTRMSAKEVEMMYIKVMRCI